MKHVSCTQMRLVLQNFELVPSAFFPKIWFLILVRMITIALMSLYSDCSLLSMVRSVSEDKLYDTIEFNEFLRMMSKQGEEEIKMDMMVEAFRYMSV